METEVYKGFTIEVKVDQDAENPRSWGGSCFTMACAHRNYNLGDKQIKDHDTLMEELSGMEFYDNAYNHLTYEEMRSKMQAIVDKNYTWLPLYLYDHSGITMRTSSFSCRWDSGQVGIIYISNADIRKEYNVKRITQKMREKVLLYMRGEVETYDDYLTGSVYGFNIAETDDSVWGYYGSDHEASGLLQEARYRIDYHIKSKQSEHWQQLKTWIKNRVPLMYRKELSII